MGEKEGFLPFYKGFQTICMHHSQDPAQWKSKAVIPHIVLSTTFQLDNPKKPQDYVYSRAGNPTRTILQNVLSAINRGKYSLCYSSGISALVAVLGVLNTGQHVVCNSEVSEETYQVFNNIAKNYNICTTFTNFNDLSNVCAAVQENTKLIWADNPTDPLLNIIDLCSLADIAKAKDVLLGINNTFLTPYLQRPLEFGADIVMQSLTKYINGHSDVTMGNVTVNSDDLHDKLRQAQIAAGMIPSPFDCYQALRGIKTLNIRMDNYIKKFCKNGEVSRNTSNCDKSLKTHPKHDVFRCQASGHSGGLPESKRLLKSLKLFTITDIEGGCESTIQIPSVMSHNFMPGIQKTLLCITDNLIRVSIGLENICDLISDLEQSLDNLRN
ncbi:hypothetical protein NQ317_014726 [Molorchus minor]|uniref:cystathionine gamma-lyase n=1 Tax=Molorchus minor TaxID=1323400 RepID=A0ABQ9J2N3_9CUCU|nr:hypothetical protein NQ317_014726 [Molorchus minor]